MGFLLLDGSAGSFPSAPDIAAYDLSDTFFLASYVAMDDWTPATATALVGQYRSSGGQRSYLLLMSPNGRPGFRASDDGAIDEFVQPAAAYGHTDGTGHWVGAGFNGGVIQFFDGGTVLASPAWTQHGADVTLATVVACNDSTALMEMAARNAGAIWNLAGKLYRSIVYSDLARTTRVLDADFTDLTAAEVAAGSFIEDSPNAAVVTLNGSDWSYVFDPERVIRSPRYGITRVATR